jgi:excisionase family DNA binding protein
MILNEQSTSFAEISCLLWNDRQIATAIGVTVKRVQELARMGLLPGFKLGKHWRFDPEEVRSWVKRNGRTKEALPNNDRVS